VTEIRAARADDGPAVEAIWTAVAGEGEWLGAELPLRAGWGLDFLAAIDDPDKAWFVAEVDRAVVGAVLVQDERGVSHLGMAVLEGHRGAGLGGLLLDAAVEWARGHGAHKVTLQVWPHNARARRLYQSAGFHEEGVLRRHYRRRSGELWDAVVMGLVLDRDAPGHP
jgi:ribosomal protein S18 acetylase RimI-like enzyme